MKRTEVIRLNRDVVGYCRVIKKNSNKTFCNRCRRWVKPKSYIFSIGKYTEVCLGCIEAYAEDYRKRLVDLTNKSLKLDQWVNENKDELEAINFLEEI